MDSYGLFAFDLDDTLLKSKADVEVERNGINCGPISFTAYQLQEGERFVFNQHRSSKLFSETAKPMDNIGVVSNLKTMCGHWNDFIILSGRATFDDPELFHATLEKYHIKFPKEDIVLLGTNAADKFDIAKFKANYIDQKLLTGKYDTVTLMDDSQLNLDYFLKLKFRHPNIGFNAWLVKDNDLMAYIGTK